MSLTALSLVTVGMHDSDLEPSISLHTTCRCIWSTVALLRHVAYASLFGLRLMS